MRALGLAKIVSYVFAKVKIREVKSAGYILTGIDRTSLVGASILITGS